MDGSSNVHHTNIQTLLLEMHKTKHNLSESCVKVLFSAVNGNYNLRPMVFCKKGVLRNFVEFTGKHLFFFNKVVNLRPATLFKKRLRHKCFPVNFANF